MTQRRIPAVFMRGGTSNAIVFHQKDLPTDRKLWDDIFLAAIGGPDPYGRQLDGMGGGFTSVSKVCVIGPPTRDDAAAQPLCGASRTAHAGIADHPPGDCNVSDQAGGRQTQ